MSEAASRPIRVLLAVDFSAEIVQSLQAISDRLVIERHFPDVPDSAYAEAEILYTMRQLPNPGQVPQLRWLHWHFAGVERLLRRPIARIETIELTNTSGIHATQIAEYCLAMMLAFMVQLPRLAQLKAQRQWPENPPELFSPHGLRGLTLGIVGYGSLGRELARCAHAFGLTVLAVKRDVKHPADIEGYTEPNTGDPAGDIPERLYPPQAVGSMARECDFLVVTVPLTDQTRHLIDEATLQQMKNTAIFINVARGNVVDEAALIAALTTKKIAGAALDVFEEEPLPASSPLWPLENVIISPHVSGNTSRYQEKAAALFAENLRRYVENRPLLNRVNRERGY